MSDLYVVNQFTGAQLGTKANPMVARSADDFDALLTSIRSHDELALHLEGLFQTRGVYQWGQYASRNLGKGWTVDGDAEIALENPPAMDSQPLFCLAGPARSVSRVTTRGNHSALAKDWQGTLRTGGILLEGDGSIDRVTFRDFGSKGAEAFVAEIVDGTGQASITNCLFTDYDPQSSDTQVTVFMIGGDYDMALMQGNETRASGEGNWVQGHTIYKARSGIVRGNTTIGARTGYYADFFANRNRTIDGNSFLQCEHGIQLQLSPTAGSVAGGDLDLEMPKYFSHEDYMIGPNTIQSSSSNVLLDPMGPQTATRYMRNIQVDSSLSLDNRGATNVTRTGAVAKKGCNPFGFLNK